MLEYLKNGGSREEYFAVTSQFNEALQLNDENTVMGILYHADKNTAESEFKKMTPEQVAEKAKEVRALIRENKETHVKKMFEESKARQEQYREQVRKEMQINKDAVAQSLSKLDKLYDMPVSEQLRRQMVDKWNSGEFERHFSNDPEFVARVIASHLTAEHTLKNLLGKVSEAFNNGNQQAKESLLRMLHSLPPKKDAVPGALQTNQKRETKDNVPFGNMTDKDFEGHVEVVEVRN